MLVFHTRDALDTEFRLDSTADDLATVDLGLVHPMTGHVFWGETGRCYRSRN